MISNAAKIDVKVEDRHYSFICDANAPLGEVFDVLSRMRQHIAKVIEEASSVEKPKEEGQKDDS